MLFRYIFCFISILMLLEASWIQEYQVGVYNKMPNKIYAMVQEDISQLEYKSIAFKEAMSDISNQLFSQVNSKQFLEKNIKGDDFSQNFKQRIYIVSNLPIHGATKEKEKIENGKYFLLMSFDKKDVAHIYKDKANELAKELNTVVEDYKKQKNISSKEIILTDLSKKLEKYEKYSLVARLLNQKEVIKPNIMPYFIEKELREIYNVTTDNIEDLSKILANILKKSNIKNSVNIMPFYYENKATYSPFSSELKSYLEKELSNAMNITSKQDSLYKLSGNYFIKNNKLIVKAILYDSFGDIELVAMAKMNIASKNKKYYIPKINEYSSLNEAILDKNLNVQVRMNKMTKNLLFKKGQVVNIEVKVSKEAYIYVIGNMRTKEGKQIQYLMSLTDSKGRSQYRKHIPYQNSNLWVSIGEFEVYPPFGTEVLQVFAANIDILNKFPNVINRSIDGEEYDVIIDENKKIMVATRSISSVRGIKKVKKNMELQKAEAILKFTTVSR